MSGLLWSDEIAADAAAIRAEVEQRLAALGVPGRVELTGASSMPGVLTKGDVDLHLRVGPEAFAEALARLADVYTPTSLSAWGETLAVFDVPGARPTGLAVTPVGSEHDRRFRRSWERLAAEPDLLAEYNAMKQESFGDPSHEQRKAAFFTRIASRSEASPG